MQKCLVLVLILAGSGLLGPWTGEAAGGGRAFDAPLLPQSTEGPYTYDIVKGEAIITGFDNDYPGFTGELSITNELGGYPVTAIEGGVFSYGSVTVVTLPDTLTDIGSEPFRGCPTTFFHVDPANPAFNSTNGILCNKSLTEIIRYPGYRDGDYAIPETVTSIAGGAFGRCHGLTGVTIPAGVAQIGGRAFGFSPDIEHLTVHPDNPHFSSVEGVLFNKEATVLLQYPGGRVGAYTIPEGISVIPGMAFAECQFLTSIVLPRGLTRIAWGAFIGCISLTQVTIPAGVNAIEDYSFYGCSGLDRVYFEGDAPETDEAKLFWDPDRDQVSDKVTVYRCFGASGWGQTYGQRPVVVWDPRLMAPHPDPGGGGMAVTITGQSGIPVAVDGTTNLLSGVWTRICVTNLSSGALVLIDADASGYAARFYRVSGP